MKYEKKIKKMLESFSRKGKLFRRKKYVAYFLIGVMLIGSFINYEKIFGSAVSEPEKETVFPIETTESPREEAGTEIVTPEPEKETVFPIETKEPPREEAGTEIVTPEPEKETVSPIETKEPSKEEPEIEDSTLEPEIEESNPPEQETNLPIESQEPEDSDKNNNIEETIVPSESPLESESPEEKEKKEQEKMQEEIISVMVPTNANIMIDPYNILGNGQIYSTEIEILNENEFDIEVKLEQLEYYLDTSTEIETDSNKNCNLYLERLGTEFKQLLEPGCSENFDIFSLKSGEIDTYRFTGDIVPGTEHLWKENDIQVKLKFSFANYQNNTKDLEKSDDI